MRKVIYCLNVSIDGFVEDSNGSLEWGHIDEELLRFYSEQEREFDAQLYGRRIYEAMAGHWTTVDRKPSASAHEIEFAPIWRSIPKVVFSTTLEQVGANARLVRDNIAEEVNALKGRTQLYQHHIYQAGCLRSHAGCVARTALWACKGE